ncbi:MAG TPA: hypothetical protein VN903_36520 [Polyangia bacterium]|nr:hypothetical protein [Polyangia bacterium]
MSADGPRVRVIPPGVSGADLAAMDEEAKASNTEVRNVTKPKAKLPGAKYKAGSAPPAKPPRQKRCSRCGSVGHTAPRCGRPGAEPKPKPAKLHPSTLIALAEEYEEAAQGLRKAAELLS